MASNPYVNKVVVNDTTLIDLTADTVDAAHLAEGYTAHDLSGAPIVGTMAGGTPVIQSKSITANGTYTAPSGVDGFSPVVVNVPKGTLSITSVNNTLAYPTSKSTYSAWSTAVTSGGGKLNINLSTYGITSWDKFGGLIITGVLWSGSGSTYMSVFIYKSGSNLKAIQLYQGEAVDLTSTSLPNNQYYISFPTLTTTSVNPVGQVATSSLSLTNFTMKSFYKSSNTAAGKYYADAIEIRQAQVLKIT